jgi:hypothetical protein
VADLLDGLARFLEGLGLLEYDPDGVAGDTFIDDMPSAPHEAVVLSCYGGPEADSKLGWDEPSVQVRVRGGPDPRVSRDRCRDIRSALHGLGPITLPDGTFLQLCIAVQGAPATLGKDDNGRHEHVVNFRTEVRSVTAHRV